LARPETACPWPARLSARGRYALVSHGWRHAAVLYAGSAGEIQNAIKPREVRSRVPPAVVTSVAESVSLERRRKIKLEIIVKDLPLLVAMGGPGRLVRTAKRVV